MKKYRKKKLGKKGVCETEKKITCQMQLQQQSGRVQAKKRSKFWFFEKKITHTNTCGFTNTLIKMRKF